MACPFAFALDNAGKSIAARMAIIAITTSNSISVKARRLIGRASTQGMNKRSHIGNGQILRRAREFVTGKKIVSFATPTMALSVFRAEGNGQFLCAFEADQELAAGNEGSAELEGDASGHLDIEKSKAARPQVADEKAESDF